VGGKGALDGPILREDLDRETAYNTYKINGLPPTPIANPGRASIEAVLRPANSKDLYFVADGTGGHVFAATLDEHNKNVFKWRKIERELRAQEAAAKAEQEAAAPAAGQGTAEAAAEPGAAPPLTAGAPVPKTVPGTMAADPMSGTLADPAILMAPSQPLEAPAGAAAGEAVPAPPRNPKR
jgi:UPF0755 protein